MCVVSPHLDDAALSCGQLLVSRPGATVLTVCAGAPTGRAGEWDRATTGKEKASDALEERRREDTAAMAALGVSPVWLELGGIQYESEERAVTAIEDGLRAVLSAAPPLTVVAPLGIHHPDHVAVSDACLTLSAELGFDLYCFADVPYRLSFPEQLDARLRILRARSDALTALEPLEPVHAKRKRAAVGAYRSQLPALRAIHPRLEDSIDEPELYWHFVVGASRQQRSRAAKTFG